MVAKANCDAKRSWIVSDLEQTLDVLSSSAKFNASLQIFATSENDGQVIEESELIFQDFADNVMLLHLGDRISVGLEGNLQFSFKIERGAILNGEFTPEAIIYEENEDGPWAS